MIGTRLAGGNGIQSVAFLPNSNCLTFVNADQKLEGWDVIEGKTTFLLDITAASEGKRTRGAHLAVAPNGRWLAVETVSRKGVDLWDIDGQRLLIRLPVGSGTIWRLAWSPDGSLLAVARSDGSISIWNLPETRRQLATLGLDWSEGASHQMK